MPWPFDLRFMQLALLAGLVVGASAPLIGVFLVQKRMSLIGDGIGHLGFAGVTAGLLVEEWTGISPVWTALAVAVVGAVGIEGLRRRGKTSGDLALALFFYGAIALGVVLAGLSSSLNATILSFLFGSILTVTTGDVWLVVGLGLVTLLVVAVAYRALFAIVLDEESARVAGIPVATLNTVLVVLTAVIVVAAMQVVGLLLIAALMVLPVATTQQFARSFRATLVGAVAVGIGSVVAGLTASRAWGLAPGGSIVLVAALTFGLASVLRIWRRAGDTTLPTEVA
jgi:zinc transport system permease protein